MSQYHFEKITCPKCHCESEFQVWDSINTMLDPELKHKVRSGEVFCFTCKECGAESNVAYTLLYHQMEDHIMIYYVLGDPTEAIEMMKGKYRNSNGELVDLEMNIYDCYRNRVVRTKNHFKEKLLILDEGLDDRVIELIKFFMVTEIQEKHPNLEVEEFLFEKMGEESINFALNLGNGKWMYTDYPQYMYDYIANKFKDSLPIKQEDVEINFEWALNLLDA